MPKHKVILNLDANFDGFMEGPNGEFDLCFGDQNYGIRAFMKSSDSIFMKRRSYEAAMKRKEKNPYPHIGILKEATKYSSGLVQLFYTQ